MDSWGLAWISGQNGSMGIGRLVYGGRMQSIVLSFRLPSQRVRSMVELAAREQGMTLSEFGRVAILDALAKTKSAPSASPTPEVPRGPKDPDQT